MKLRVAETPRFIQFVGSIIRSAIANRRNPTAPRQNPTGSSRKVVCANAVAVPTENASAASAINTQQMFRMREL
jgi:hypothetical protein